MELSLELLSTCLWLSDNGQICCLLGQSLYLMTVASAGVVSVGARLMLMAGPHVVTLRLSLLVGEHLFRIALL